MDLDLNEGIRGRLCTVVCRKLRNSCNRALKVLQRVAHHGKHSEIVSLAMHADISMDLASSKIERRQNAQSHQLETESYD